MPIKKIELKFLKIFAGLVIIIYFFPILVLADGLVEEKFTITSYYPSPGGSYNEITTTGNTYLAVSGNGNVGIGTTAPQGLLQVGTSPSPGLVVDTFGNVGIGTTAGAYKLAVDGNIYLNGTIEMVGESPLNSRATGSFTSFLKVLSPDTGQCVISVTKGVIRFTSC